MEGLVAVREKGLTEEVGACNIGFEQLQSAQVWAQCQGVRGLAYVQNMFNLRDPGTDADVRACCRDQGVRYIPYSPLGGGILSGKYRKGQELPAGSRLSLREDFRKLLEPQIYRMLDVLQSEADKLSCSMSALALNWVGQHNDVFLPVVGPSREAPHLAHVAESFQLAVPQETIGILENAFSGGLHH